MKEWLFCFFCEASWTKIVVSFAVSIAWAVVALIRSIRTSSTVWVWISIILIIFIFTITILRIKGSQETG